MNRENMQKAIAVMKRVAANKDHKFNISMWQTGNVATTEQEAIDCGTICCFAGWLAISPEFKGQLSVTEAGVPVSTKSGYTGHRAIGEIFNIPDQAQVLNMCGMSSYPANDFGDPFLPTDFYDVKYWSDITPEVIVKKLEQMLLRDIGE